MSNPIGGYVDETHDWDDYGYHDNDRVRHRAKKDTRTWCKGKVGRRHNLVIVRASWAFGDICKLPNPGHSWQPNWCAHQERCADCGKILRHALPIDECPDLNHCGRGPCVLGRNHDGDCTLGD